MEDKKDMTYQELIHGYRAKGYKLKYYGKVKENRRTYRLYKIVINPRYKKTLLITTGFHGEEFNGPISLLEIFDEVVACAKKMRVRLIVYPCVNPSGFDLHKRYNASDIGDKKPNNDFMRYEINEDNWVGTLRAGESFLSFKPVNSPAQEVRALQRNLKLHGVPHGVLDIHQQKDNLNTGEFYAYIFNQRPLYLQTMQKLKVIAQVATLDAWKEHDDDREIDCRIDEDGFVFLHDGTLTDMLYRLGSKFVVTSETKTTMPLEKVCQINLIWIKELIKLITKK